ncbi:non-ribosomal peptide synthetase [Streptomyces sp. NPDC047072]|uniref:non-ribosomal peptide synthetase n=1 Tax=Streptomyces sp. NPDC047072 TaxID=3154809 RepID=UPI00340FBAD1
MESVSIVEQLDRVTRDAPDAPAVSDAAETLTYARLWARIRAMAGLLRASGSTPGAPVGVCMAPTASRLAALLGTMAAGSPYVPIDPHFPDDRIRAVVEGSGVGRILVDESTAGRFAALPYRTADASAWPSYDGTGPNDLRPPGSSDLAYVIHTSGSTGAPKGVGVEHGSVSRLFDALDEVIPQLPDRSAQRWLAAANFCFDMSIVDLYWPLTRGIPLVLADIDSLAGRSAEGAEFLTGQLASGRVTHFQSTPSLVQLMLRDPTLATAVRGLHVLVMGGEIVQPELVAQLRPIPHVFNGYGPTETTVYTTLHPCTAADANAGQVPIGRALRGVELRVVGEDGRERPYGELGELLIGGTGLARGYLGDAELTARKFPVLGEGADRRRWYRTGDLVTLGADGTVRYRGRVDSQVKVRGYRVELGEIETAIRAVPGVEEAAVFPVRDDSGRVVRLTAAAKATAAKATAAAVTGDDVLARIGRVLPPYAVPQSVTVLAELPLGHTGKLDRKALERLLTERPAAPVPAPRAPLGEVERAVAEAWDAVLDDDVSADTGANFFDLGGNSLLLGSVLTRLRRRFPDARLGLVEMYRYPTVPALAARIRTGPTSGTRPSRQGARRSAPLSTADRRRLARRGE